MKDIINMDKTGLFNRLQPNYSVATKQLEGKKQTMRLTTANCDNENDSEKKKIYGSLTSMLNHNVSQYKLRESCQQTSMDDCNIFFKNIFDNLIER